MFDLDYFIGRMFGRLGGVFQQAAVAWKHYDSKAPLREQPKVLKALDDFKYEERVYTFGMVDVLGRPPTDEALFEEFKALVQDPRIDHLIEHADPSRSLYGNDAAVWGLYRTLTSHLNQNTVEGVAQFMQDDPVFKKVVDSGKMKFYTRFILSAIAREYPPEKLASLLIEWERSETMLKVLLTTTEGARWIADRFLEHKARADVRAALKASKLYAKAMSDIHEQGYIPNALEKYEL